MIILSELSEPFCCCCCCCTQYLNLKFKNYNHVSNLAVKYQDWYCIYQKLSLFWKQVTIVDLSSSKGLTPRVSSRSDIKNRGFPILLKFGYFSFEHFSSDFIHFSSLSRPSLSLTRIWKVGKAIIHHHHTFKPENHSKVSTLYDKFLFLLNKKAITLKCFKDLS